MNLSMTTDYVTDRGDPSPYLRHIAEAGFSHIHWCHHWRSDFLYADVEIEQIKRWLDTYGLQLLDLHGSEGIEKFWYSPHEYARLAGVELVKNRIDLTAALGAHAVVMHVNPGLVVPGLEVDGQIAWDQLRRSLDDLAPYATARGVRIAVENLFAFRPGAGGEPAQVINNFDIIDRLLRLYPPGFLGICYDSGHANIGGDHMDRLEPLLDRLYVLHMHDNDGHGDQHRLIFADTVDWPRLAGLIARSVYDGPVSMELLLRNMEIDGEEEFLRQAYETGRRFSRMIDDARTASRAPI